MNIELNNLALVLICFGALFMLLAIFKTLKLLQFLNQIKEKNFSWKILFLLMIFFFIGYIVSFILILTGLKEVLIVLTGLVFLFGALFVYVVVRVSTVTIAILNKKNKTEELNLELEKNITYLKDANKELEQFTYIISHDLQEPLRTIANFVGLLVKNYKGKLDSEADQFMNIVLKATTKMQNLIKDLLVFSRIGKGMTFETVDSNEVLKEIIEEMKPAINESNSKITISKLPVIYGNKIELKRLFQNLLDNAMKFRKESVSPQIEIDAEAKESEYLFKIKDNGIGIDPQYKDKLFVMFQRLQNENEYEGTGIGLAASKKIVKLHNGEIWFESKFGEGTTFYFTIAKGKLNE